MSFLRFFGKSSRLGRHGLEQEHALRWRLGVEQLEDRLDPSATTLILPNSGYAGDGKGGTVMNVPISINQLQDNGFPTNHVGLARAQLAVTFHAPNHGKLWKSLVHAHLGDYEQREAELREVARDQAIQRS